MSVKKKFKGLSDKAVGWLFIGPTVILLLAINIYHKVSRLDTLLKSWRLILWDLEFKFGSIQLDGHFCLFIQIFASDNSKRL